MLDHHQMLAFVPLHGAGKAVEALYSHHVDGAAQKLIASIDRKCRIIGERAGSP